MCVTYRRHHTNNERGHDNARFDHSRIDDSTTHDTNE